MNRRELILIMGGVMTAARALRAQQKKMPVVGYLNGSTLEANAVLLAAFRQGLSETGWVEGQNLKVEYRWARGNYALLPTLAGELVARSVDVLVASTQSGLPMRSISPKICFLSAMPSKTASITMSTSPNPS